MSTALRATYAHVDKVQHRLKATATLLGISENTLYNTLSESGIEVKRANEINPNSPAIRLFDLPTIFQIANFRREKRGLGLVGNKPVYVVVQLVKGGTGKSTSAAEIAVQLQLEGLKVLLIDLDIQANLTQLMGYEADLTKDDMATYGLSAEAIVNGTFNDLCEPMFRKSPTARKPAEVIKYPFGPHGPALVPADTYLGDLEQSISALRGARELTFRKFFEKSKNGEIPGFNVSEYDCVIFDCPPNVSFVSTNALAVADIVVAPTRLESFSVKGLSRLTSEIEALEEEYGKDREKVEMMILPTHFSSNVTRNSRMQSYIAQYGGRLSPVSIAASEEFPRSSENYLPLTLTKPTSKSVTEYREFVQLLLKKIGAKSKGGTA